MAWKAYQSVANHLHYFEFDCEEEPIWFYARVKEYNIYHSIYDLE